MTDLATLQTLYDYHDWANARLLTACAALTSEQWDLSLGHSWGSVHGLLAHMLAAEIIWLARWNGQSPAAWRQASEFPALADVRRAGLAVEQQLRAFLRACDDFRLAQAVTYQNTRGQEFTFPLGRLMLHLANHGTHHRAEAAAMLAVLEVAHPEDDLLLYFIETK